MFNWDVIAHEEAADPFEFEASGHKWRVPHPRDLTVGQMLALDRGMVGDLSSAAVAVRDTAERWNPKTGKWVKDPNRAAALVIGRRADQVGPFLAAWAAHGGLKQGESQGSSR